MEKGTQTIAQDAAQEATAPPRNDVELATPSSFSDDTKSTEIGDKTIRKRRRQHREEADEPGPVKRHRTSPILSTGKFQSSFVDLLMSFGLLHRQTLKSNHACDPESAVRG